MQSIKNVFVSILLTIIVFNTSLSSNAPTTSIPVVEIYNKDEDSILIQVGIDKTGEGKIYHMIAYATIPSNAQGKILSSNVINIQTQVLRISILKNNEVVGEFSIKAPGKTKYLTWSSAKKPSLYPQTGPLMGLMGRYNPLGQGKTESGLPLHNNVSEKQIVEVKH